jgi:hypothetical protein
MPQPRLLPLLCLLVTLLLFCSHGCGGTTDGKNSGTASGPSCSDGLQNGAETGIDCGGGCGACSVTASCSDGVLNQDETGVDCGGSCTPCTTGTCADGEQGPGETGVDCGGPCPNQDCCTNGYADVDLDETGVDCGGSCGDCGEATTYFIANDGDDELNSGTLPTEPWASLAKVNEAALRPGDSVLFKRGDTWREELVITRSGSEGAHITFGAYGSGAKPRILGSEQATGWSRVDGHDGVWQAAPPLDAPHAGHPASIFFGELDGEGATTWGRVQDIHGVNTCGGDFTNLQTEYDWCWEADRLYVFAPENPEARYRFVEVPQRRGAITMENHNPQEYITIDGLELMYGTMYGYNDGWPMDYEVRGLDIRNCHVAYIGIRGGDSAMGLVIWHSDMAVRGNDIHDCGRRGISYNVYVDNGRHNQGLIFENVLFQNNTLHNGYHTTGFDISHGSGMVDTLRNFTFRGNFIWDDATDDIVAPNDFTSMGLYLHAGDAIFTDVTIINNIVKNPKQKGFAISDVDNLVMANNTLYGMNPNIDGYRSLVHIAGDNANLTFINNIIYGTIDRDNFGMRCLYISDSTTTQASRLDHNLYFQADEGQYIVYTDGSGFHMDEWDTYRQATGWDANSPTPAAPLFIDPENNDFRLSAGSPAIDAGVSVAGRTSDQVGNPITASPDLGALEFQE